MKNTTETTTETTTTTETIKESSVIKAIELRERIKNDIKDLEEKVKVCDTMIKAYVAEHGKSKIKVDGQNYSVDVSKDVERDSVKTKELKLVHPEIWTTLFIEGIASTSTYDRLNVRKVR